MVSLEQISLDIWKTNFERKGISESFKPIFVRYIGVENLNTYNNILKTIQIKSQENEAYIFDNEIPYKPDFNLIKYLKNELITMDLGNLENQDITLFQDSNFNKKFLKALQYVVNIEEFPSQNSKIDFIITMLCLGNSYIKAPTLIDKTIKYIYYGNIIKDDFKFLLLCHLMDNDVLYINPINDIDFTEIDKYNLTQLHKNTGILPIESFSSRSSQGQELSVFNTQTLRIEQNIEEVLFTDGIFKPWQLRGYNVNDVIYNPSIIDLENSLNEPAKVRDGFNISNKTVTIPHFFYEVEGEYSNPNEYINLVNKTKNNAHVVLNSTQLKNNHSNNYDELINEIIFSLDANGLLINEKTVNFSFYEYAKYNDLTELFILNKINEFLEKEYLNIDYSDKENKLKIIFTLLTLNDNIIKLIDNFDYSSNIPKLVYFLENENSLELEDGIILMFLSSLGFDVVIYSPAGMSNLSSYIKQTYHFVTRLETLNYNRTYNSLKTIKEKTNIINSIFKRFK